MVLGCFAGAPGRGFRRCPRTRHWVLDCTLSLGLQKVTLEAVFLTPFGTCVWLFRRCPRTRLWVLDCTLSLGLQKVMLEAVFLMPFGT